MADGTVKITIDAPPVDGKANLALSGWLAGQFGTTADNVTIITGRQSRIKTVRIREPGSTRPPWFNEA